MSKQKKNSNKKAANKRNKKIEKRKKKTSSKSYSRGRGNADLYSECSDLYMGDYNSSIFDEYNNECKEWWREHYGGMAMPNAIEVDVDIPDDFLEFKREAYNRMRSKLNNEKIDVDIYPHYHSTNSLDRVLELQSLLVYNARQWTNEFPNLKPSRKALEVVKSSDLIEGYTYLRGVVSNVNYSKKNGKEFISEFMMIFPEILITNDLNFTYSWNMIADHIWISLNDFVDATHIMDNFSSEDYFAEDEIVSFDLHLGDTLTILAKVSDYEDVGGNNRTGVSDFFVCQQPKLCYRNILNKRMNFVKKDLQKKLKCRLFSYTMSLRLSDYQELVYLMKNGRRSIGGIIEVLESRSDTEERIMKTPFNKIPNNENQAELAIKAYRKLNKSIDKWIEENNNTNADAVLEDLKKFLIEQRTSYMELKEGFLDEYQHMVNRAVYSKNGMKYLEEI